MFDPFRHNEHLARADNNALVSKTNFHFTLKYEKYLVRVLVVVPFTLIVIKPTNDELLASGRDLASAGTRALLERWGRLHAVRSFLIVLSTVVMLWQLAL